MVLKRDHDDAEIKKLGEKFRESWSEGQIIRSWLRSHSEELRKLVREEDWSWANIGRALSAAGIQFNTGKAWTGENVRRAVDLATKPRKTREPRSNALPGLPVASAAPPSFPARALVPEAPARLSGEPEFRIIRRGPGAPARDVAQSEPDSTEAAQLKRGES